MFLLITIEFKFVYVSARLLREFSLHNVAHKRLVVKAFHDKLPLKPTLYSRPFPGTFEFSSCLVFNR